MSGLSSKFPVRDLCQILLNGSPDGGVLQAVEDNLKSALAMAAENERAQEAFGEIWKPVFLPNPADDVSRRAILKALAPTLLLDGVWLARVAQPATAHQPSESHLFELYCRIVGLDDPAHSPPWRFRASLITAGVHLPFLDSPGFFHDPAFPELALPFPCLHLGLMHRPRTFFPELLGYTLAHVYRESAWWDAPWPEGSPLRIEIRALAVAALDAYPHREVHGERIRTGWKLYRHRFDTLLRDLGERFAHKPTAEDAMADVVRAKRRHAIGYHQRIMLQGRRLDQWLAESKTDLRPLLRALRDSPWVNPACPAGSRLIRAMEFGGEMFGVFSAEERRACLEWIEDAEKSGQGANADTYSGESALPAAIMGCSGNRDRETAPTIRSERQLFTALLRTESPADCPPAADAAIQRILRRTRWLSPLQRGRRRFFPYDPERFRRHIEAVHRHEVERYRPLSGPPKISKGYCRWAVLQMAPAILVDGGWLAGIATASEKLGDMGRHLVKIHADELGNGRPEWNHPNVYRRLLESLAIELPPFDSDAFARDLRFLDAAFDIPVYLLAVGQLAGRYLPELLGLNLAIELSGLGAGYRRVIEILRHYGIDPSIIQLHLSIDNLASGHAARAEEAIVLYLDEVRRREGMAAVQAQWKRIWTGYLSLNLAAGRMAARFLMRYLRECVLTGNAGSCKIG
jgi:hypothetical protein